MADAYCGPSNALQNFQKHSSVDRTLQQDRLTQRRSPLEGFRSHEPNAAVLDPEFEAFQASQPGPLPFAEPPQATFQSFNQRGKQPAFGPGPNGADWASDFQRLHVSSPGPQMQQSPSPAQFRSSPAAMSQSSSPAPLQTQYTPQFSQSRMGGFGGYGAFGGGMSQGFMQQPMQAEAPQQAQQDLDMFDEAAFERAFDMAREQIMSEEATALPDQAKEQAQSRTLDPYPHLPLLRMVMYSQFLDPTEENMHKFARHFTLLEKHNTQQIDSKQWYLFAPMLRSLASTPQYPFAQRYRLAERARAMFPDWETLEQQTKANPDDRVEHAFAFYDKLRHRLNNQYKHTEARARSVIDNEMMHDIQQQLDKSSGKELAEQVFEGLPHSVVKELHTLRTGEYDVVADENQLMYDSIPAQFYNAKPQQDPGQILERNDANLSAMWNMVHAATFAPEAVEMRDALGTQTPADLDRMQFEGAIQALPEQAAQEQQRQEPIQHDENDDLARTAGQLLDKVKDNQSTKFQNSQFLDLMRRLRDREVRVEGDKMVETNLSALDHDELGASFPAPQVPFQSNGAGGMTGQTQPMSNDIHAQELRDGEDVVRMLDEPGTLEQGRPPISSFSGPDEDLGSGITIPGHQ
ncbi:hypothetical protein B9Z65_2241 [Elsinoe australis]|uniref:Uncharacterized protein n=1 Tax=Elsinoe australis TaxID=40998 RepID=A0A2P7YNH1_9PEZI|nr:hypothetical protein B9Z65_2241 [Elsinoe australis]